MNYSISDEMKRKANETDLVSILEHNGQQVKRVGSEYEWKDGGQTVSIKGNLWFHQYEQIGGTTVGFIRKFWGLSYPEAVQFILNEDLQSEKVKVEVQSDKATHRSHEATFKLPDKNEDMRRTFAYLTKTRGSHSNIL